MHVNGADAFFFSSSPEKEREKEREEAIKSMDTRSEGQVAVLDAKLNKGVHFVLIHAGKGCRMDAACRLLSCHV